MFKNKNFILDISFIEMASGTQTCEYRTIKRYFSIIVKSLGDTIDPVDFAQKLHEVNLVTSHIVQTAGVQARTVSQRIHPVITAVHSQIELNAANYCQFVRIVRGFNSVLADLLEKFHGELISWSYYCNIRSKF